MEKHINIISSKISRAMFAINRIKYLLQHNDLKTLDCTLIQSNLTYGVYIWGNGDTVTMLQTKTRCMNN